MTANKHDRSSIGDRILTKLDYGNDHKTTNLQKTIELHTYSK